MGRVEIAHERPVPRIVRVEFGPVDPALAQVRDGRPLRLGRGERCALAIDGKRGPELICELERPSGPVRASCALDLDDPQASVEVLINGQRLSGRGMDVRPGSRVEVVERGTGRRYSVVVAAPAWYVRPRLLAAILAAAIVAGVAYGGYLYRTLSGARGDLLATRAQLGTTAADLAKAQALIDEVQDRLANVSGEMTESVAALRGAQAARERALRAEFDIQLESIAAAARLDVERLAARDVQGRQRLLDALERAMQVQVKAVEANFAERMVAAYQAFKQLETQLTQSVSTRLAALEPASTHFKRVLESGRDAVVFVQTTYEVEFPSSEQVRTQQGLGTGFVIAPSGLAMSARHVFYPWEYDRELQVLIKLELARVRPDSAKWTVWKQGAQVHVQDASADESTMDLSAAWSSSGAERRVRVVLAPPVELQQGYIESPLGTVAVEMPLPGASDALVFQLGPDPADPDAQWVSLPIVPVTYRAAPLDDVLVMGFPLSRLAEGRAFVQGVTGLVRHDRAALLEMNIAFSPGVSGGPIVNRTGAVIGLASGIAQSESYGLAVRGADLARLRDEAVALIRAEETRLEALGCSPGPVDGIFDGKTWTAYDCEVAGDASRVSKD